MHAACTLHPCSARAHSPPWVGPTHYASAPHTCAQSPAHGPPNPPPPPGALPPARLSKAAANMAAQLLAMELKPQGIPLVAIHPGAVATDMHAQVGAAPLLSSFGTKSSCGRPWCSHVGWLARLLVGAWAGPLAPPPVATGRRALVHAFPHPAQPLHTRAGSQPPPALTRSSAVLGSGGGWGRSRRGRHGALGARSHKRAGCSERGAGETG